MESYVLLKGDVLAIHNADAQDTAPPLAVLELVRFHEAGEEVLVSLVEASMGTRLGFTVDSAQSITPKGEYKGKRLPASLKVNNFLSVMLPGRVWDNLEDHVRIKLDRISSVEQERKKVWHADFGVVCPGDLKVIKKSLTAASH